MSSTFKCLCLIYLIGYSTSLWAASTSATPNSEKNYSGTYSCKGNNTKVGDYSYTVTLKLNKTHSHDDISAYDLSGETENSTMYSGNGVAISNRMSISFRVSDQKNNIFGSGFAVFRSSPEKLWSFTTHYYEPNELGATTGSDICTQYSTPPKKLPEDAPLKKPVEEQVPYKLNDEPQAKKITTDAGVSKKTAEEPIPKKSTDDVNSKK